MSKLCISMPPLAPDYSGAASALFELGGMIVIHDAAGCTGNYTSYDEPRWLGSDAMVYCSGLRHMDAILGNDDQLIERIRKAAVSLKPNFIALLGSPVPMVIGTDFEGIANEIETVTGIPSIGLSTRGLSYYGSGERDAIITLMKKVCSSKADLSKKNEGINLLGVTPLDFSNHSNAKDFVNLFEQNGIHVNCCFTMGCTFEQFKESINSKLNVVVSQAGYDIAVYMEKTYGIPFVVGTPMCMGKIILEKVMPQKFKCQPSDHYECNDEKILIAGEQVMGNSLREYLTVLGAKKENIIVGTLFDCTSELMEKGDLVIKDEKMLRDLLNSNKYKKVVADPLVSKLITKQTFENGVKFFNFPHVAVSSKIYWKEPFPLLSKQFSELVREILKQVI